MAIEFRCTQCNKLLRTADDTAGKQAKCPECGAILPVPALGAAGPVPGASPFASSGPQPGHTADPQNPFASPTAPSVPAAGYSTAPAAAPSSSGVVDFNDAFSHTWQILKDQMGICIAVWVVYGLLSSVVSYGLQVSLFLVGFAALKNPVAAQLLSQVGLLASMFFTAWLFTGQAIFFLKIARGQQAEISDLFAGGPFYGTMIGAGILFSLAYVGGLMLCIVPGIILGLMFSQFYFLIIDRNANVMDSLSQSNELMKGNKGTVFVVLFVAGIAGGLLVACTCLIGIFVVGPFMLLLPAVIYLAVTGQPNAVQQQQQHSQQQAQ